MDLEYSTFSHKVKIGFDYGLLPIGDQVSLLQDLIRSILVDSRVKDETKQLLKEYMAEALDKL